MKVLVASPAYGRKYNSHYTLEHAWTDGKDFKIDDGPYFSIRDLKTIEELGYERVIITSGEVIYTVVVGEEVTA